MRRLARVAKKRLGADWVINNDADEFWIPKNNKSLKENLNFKKAVLTIQRYNMVPTEESTTNRDFFISDYYVKNPIFYKKTKELTNQNNQLS